jgi:hypothetical protein
MKPSAGLLVRNSCPTPAGFWMVTGLLPELVRIALQEPDDLVAHRAVLVGVTGTGGEKQLLRAEQARLKFWVCEEGLPVRFGAVTTHNVRRVTPRQRTDRDGILTASIG